MYHACTAQPKAAHTFHGETSALKSAKQRSSSLTRRSATTVCSFNVFRSPAKSSRPASSDMSLTATIAPKTSKRAASRAETLVAGAASSPLEPSSDMSTSTISVPDMIGKGLVALFGITTYAYFFYVFVALVMWAANGSVQFAPIMSTVLVPATSWLGSLLGLGLDLDLATLFPYTMDFQAQVAGSLFSGPVLNAILSNLTLFAFFAFTHSLMARPKFKKTVASWGLPFGLERPLYVLVAVLQLNWLFASWQAIPQVIYATTGVLSQLILTTSFLGWAFLFAATWSIDHFELFGLSQALGFVTKHTKPIMKVRGVYHLCRHPIMTGFLVAFWATPTMTVGRLVFNIAATIYIMIAVFKFEEPDLRTTFGEAYTKYEEDTPSLCPFAMFGKKSDRKQA